MMTTKANFNVLYHGKELSKIGAHRYADAIERRCLLSCDLSTSIEIRTGISSPTNCLALEQIENRYLLCGGMGGSISLFDLEQSTTAESNKLFPLLQHISSTATISSLQWYPEDTGAFISASMDGSVSIFDTNCFAIVSTFKFPNNVVYCAQMRSSGGHSGGQSLIAVGLQDGTVRLCDPRTSDSSHILKGHTRAVTQTAWSTVPGESFALASAGMDGAVRIWDTRRAGGLTEALLRSLDWRGDFAAEASRVDTSKLHTSLLTSSHPSQPNSYTNSSSYNTVYVKDREKVFLPQKFAVAGDKRDSALHVGRAHDAAVMSMRYSRCGNYLVTAGNDRRMRVWRCSTGALLSTSYIDKMLPTAQLPYELGVAENASAAEDVLIVPTGAGCTVRCGSNISTTSTSSTSSSAQHGAEVQMNTQEGDILLVPLHSADGEPVRLLRGHLERVTAAVYRRSYQQIISAARDGMVFLWEARRGSREQSGRGTRTGSTATQERHRQYYTGGRARYDFQQVLERVQVRDEASVPGGSVSVVYSGRVLPVTESANSTGDVSAMAHDPVRTLPAGSLDSESSGDDWSEEEEDDVTGQYPPLPLQASSKGVRNTRRRLTHIIADAHSEMAGRGADSEAHPTPVASIGAAPAPVAAGRSFVPPIIAQYLSDAHRGHPSPSVPAVPSLLNSNINNISTSSARNQSSQSAEGTSINTWQQVDSLFPDSSSNSHQQQSPGQVAASSATPTATAPTTVRALTTPVLTADQRYAAWLKQQRNKSKAKTAKKS